MRLPEFRPADKEAPLLEHDEEKQEKQEKEKPFCRICLEERAGGAARGERRLIAPCQCTGSVRFVHPECLERWRRATDINATNARRCEICHAEYQLKVTRRVRLRALLKCLLALGALLLGLGLAAFFCASCVRDIPEVCARYGVARDAFLGQLAVGWIALCWVLGFLALAVLLVREAARRLPRSCRHCMHTPIVALTPLCILVIFMDQVGDLLVHLACYEALLVICSVVGALCACAFIGCALRAVWAAHAQESVVVDLSPERVQAT